MKPAQSDQHAGDDLPRAKVGHDWKTYLFWLVPIGAALLAGWFIYSESNKGPKIHIYFADATRLEAGKSPVQYRGATIGQVEKLELTPDQKQVDATVSLKKSAAGMAREGSKFWIVKAQIGVSEIRGLGTIVSGDFITVEPGNGNPKTDFQGLAAPPIVVAPGVLRVVLLAERVGSLGPRSPVFYRGVQVGEVAGLELGAQSQTVQISLDIQARYAPLVRMDSVFWKAGGVDLNIGFSGADISAQSVKTLVSGGIDFATPDTTQKPAQPGTSFRLYEKPQDAWLGWAPAIELNQSAEPTYAPAAAPDVGGF